MAHPLHIAFVWHMHQPYYRNAVSGRCSMPWVRLHATKDYLDMLTRLEPFPSIHQTFNLVPSLVDQLEEYLPPAKRTDEFLELSRIPAAELTAEQQRFVLQWFFMANLERMIKPFPRYHDLLAKRGLHVREEDWTDIQQRFRVQDYLDLQVWFNLTWVDPWLRRQDPDLARLEAKGAQFTEDEKALVLEKHLDLVAKVIPAYREAAERGQVELTASPYYHPIMPLLCDTRAAHAALPHMRLPEPPFRHPEDARWHLREALRRHHEAFGQPPKGLWPSEGGVSEEFVRIAGEAGLAWIATDEEILWRTLKTARAPSLLYRPHRLKRASGDLAIVFRDRELSDLLGFVYSQWDPAIAVADFIRRLGEIHRQAAAGPQPALVSIILDGENAWEFYPNDGHDFLAGLYAALAADPRFRCVTVSEFLGEHPLDHAEALPELFSGSWIDGNFATWVGHPEKNAAWGHLTQAREALDAIDRNDPKRQAAWRSLGIAEGSDWMWWFGDTHYSAQADEYDLLFRTHLTNAYQLAGLTPPAALKEPIRRRAAAPLYVPTGMISPVIDGRETSYYEWLYAGRIDLRQQYAAIQRAEQCLTRVHYGFDDARQYLRFDYDPAALGRIGRWSLELAFGEGLTVLVTPDAGGARAELRGGERPRPSDAPPACALGRILELAVPFEVLALKTGEKLPLAIRLLDGGGNALEQYPTQGRFELSASPLDLEAYAWPV